jgi:SanA protein
MQKLKVIILLILTLVAVLFCNYFYISATTINQTYNDVNQIPHNSVGLLLGTSILTKDGKPNQFFTNRIKATVELYENNKIDYIIVSGDNSTYSYNEPLFMKQSLIQNNIPPQVIITDFAGFKTLDSVIRSKKVFGQNEITIISQPFHNQRALYIANYNNLKAIAFNADSVPVRKSLKVYLREVLSRFKATIERILKKQPKFLGEPIQVP